MTTISAASDAERPVEQAPETPVIKPPPPPRLRWRVVVRTGGKDKLDPSRPSRPLAWHLVSCTENEYPRPTVLKAAACLQLETIPTGIACWTASVCVAKRRSEQ